MSTETDHSNAVIRPPIGWMLAIVAGLVLDRLYPLPFVPGSVPGDWLGILIFGLGFLLAVWGVVTIRRAGSRVETTKPSTTVVTGGPYRWTRNPIYLGMFLGQCGFAVGFNSLWLLATLIPFYLVIRYGVVAREEAYLERKFGETYRQFKAAVRRWL